MLRENYNTVETAKIVYEAHKKGMQLWLQNGALKFKAPEGADISETLVKLKANKEGVIDLLKKNEIHDDQILQPYIYKLEISEAPLSSNQERIWFIEQFGNGTDAYHIPQVYEVVPGSNREAITYAVQQLVKRHTVLRSTLRQDEDGTIQQVQDAALEFGDVQVKNLEELDEAIKTAIHLPFNLTTEYPIRAAWYTLASGRVFLLINIHHIACDGWSMEIFIKELTHYYETFVAGKYTELPLPELQYTDYACWQKNFLDEEGMKKQLNFWKTKIQGFQPLQLPLDFERPKQVDYKGKQEEFKLSKELSKKLRDLAQQYGVSLNSVMLGSISILFGKYSGQEDIILGAPVANRHYHQTEGIAGFFVNTQVNRILLDKSKTFAELIRQIHEDYMEMQDYQDLPFEKLVEAIEPERDPSIHPVFQVMFSVERLASQSLVPKDNQQFLKPYALKNAYEIEKFDLSVTVDDSEEELRCQFSYATQLFRRETITAWIGHYRHLLKRLTAHPGQDYSSMSLLGEEEYKTIVNKWNQTGRSFPGKHTIHELFQDQVERTPQACAVVYNKFQLSYRELNEKSNQLAHYVRKAYKDRTGEALKPDTLIALCLDKGPELMIGILATLKTGAAYVPMDISYSKERLDYILQNTNAVLVLTQRKNAVNNFLPGEKLIYIDLNEALYHEEEIGNPPSHSSSHDLAYIIHTSGTTGQPKGVMVEHAGVVNEIRSQLSLIPLSASDNSLLTANYIFDAAAECMYMALFSGGSLHIMDNMSMLDAATVSNYIRENKISVLNTTPSYLRGLNINLKSPYLKHIILGGEAYQPFDSTARIYNTYGPTEATIVSTACEINGEDRVHIGKPIANTQTYILDASLQPVPVGVIGELYLGGAGLARGYLNRPDLTEERFISNPFASAEDISKGYTRLYKTGDTVKWLADGNIEYIGRNDDQVKIRGYRIELGEIEHALCETEGIKQCCVVVKERRNASGMIKYLVAYYSMQTGYALGSSQLIEQLSRRLPEYMVPSAFVEVESFPLTINGKLDKRALPEPSLELNESRGQAKASSHLELQLSEIYAQVLGVNKEEIGIHQNFFRIGGNSILTIQLKQKLSELSEFKSIRVADLFKYNTIGKLVESVGQASVTDYKLNQKTLSNHEIAIIGVSGAFSGVNDVEEFWKLIENQLEGVSFYSRETCRERGIDEKLMDASGYIAVGAEIKGIELFDPLFWGMSPKESRLLDPQIRKFVEHCWYALESGGYSADRKKHHIGVFAGSGSNEYFNDHILNGEMAGEINFWEASNFNSKDALATKTSFLLGLTGPANSINTACSTGLVSVVEACQKLQLGVCDMALAGGVSLLLPDKIGYVYEEGMILSKDGHCSTFDASSSGTTLGSGVGVVLLKPLQKAIEDDDTILAVIKGYATNNDGDRKTGYTAPSVIGQSECILQAQKMAGITAAEVDYVECHGTATHLGDPIEVQALKEAFEFNKSDQYVRKEKTVLGAVKANIGHADSAAGIAGLIKVCSMLKHELMPAQVNFTKPNPELNLDQTPFEILSKNKPWKKNSENQRIAGVSSFGVGGTNAHVILGDYIKKEKKRSSLQHPVIVPLSAKSRKSLENYKKELANFLSKEKNPSLIDIAYTLEEKREQFAFRSAVKASSVEELVSELTKENTFAEVVNENKNLVFMFPGQGVQYPNMSRGLYESIPFFKETVDECIEVANAYVDCNLYEVLYPEGESAYNISDTRWAQITLFIVEYALARTLMKEGIQPCLCIGHSIGEYVAATLSGVFDLKDALRLVIERGRLMQSMPVGAMLAINAAESRIKKYVVSTNCELAVMNSPEDVVVSGRKEDIQALREVLEKEQISTVVLNTSHGYHSRLMDEAAMEFEKVVSKLKLNKPTLGFISNVSGEEAGAEVTEASYWSKQLRNTVEFSKGIEWLSKKYNNELSVLEVGPGKGLSYFVNKYKSENKLRQLQTVQLLASEKEYRINPDTVYRLKSRLWMNGVLKGMNAFVKEEVEMADLPLYQFDTQKCWINKSRRGFAGSEARERLISEFSEKIRLPSLTKEEAISILKELLENGKKESPVEQRLRILEEDHTDEEYQLAQVISTILGIEELSVHDDFFKIGGNSISAIQASHRISEVLKAEIKVADIFKYKSIRALLENSLLVKNEAQGVEWSFEFR